MIKFIVLELFILLATLIIYKNIMNAYLNLVTN
jgi:hypothetical protein